MSSTPAPRSSSSPSSRSLGERHRGVFAYRSAGKTPEVETIDFRAKDIHVFGGAKIAARA